MFIHINIHNIHIMLLGCTGSSRSSSLLSGMQNRHALSKKQLLEKFASVRSDKHIQKFAICAVPSERELGKGSWGSVKQVSCLSLIMLYVAIKFYVLKSYRLK